MIRLIASNISTLILLFLISYSSISLSQKNRYWEYADTDSSSVFSINEKKPFKYGYALNKLQCNWFKSVIKDFGIKNGEVIADVGAASGWVEGVFSLFLDSVIFYVQDIDTNYLSKTQLDKVVKYYSGLRETTQTNKFIHVIGTSKKTNLPDTIFDKVILNNSLHEMFKGMKMIRDIKKKIKLRGKIIVADDFSNDITKIVHPDCNIEGVTIRDVITAFTSEGLYLTNMKEPINSISNVLTFELSQNKSDWYMKKVGFVETYIQDIDKLYISEVSKDSLFTKKLGRVLRTNYREIHDVYETLENHISQIAYYWFSLDKFSEAANVLKLNIVLYPNFSNYANLGYALRKMHMYEEALFYYKKASELDPSHLGLKKEISKAEKILQSMR